MDVPLPGEETAKKKVTLTFVQSKLLNTSTVSNEESPEKQPPSPPPTTDHFLTIIPKPTLLGKQQAKKRLQAFGAAKFSPVAKKLPEVAKKEGKTDEEKKAKKASNPDDRAKGIIEEIETIKKNETSILDAALKHRIAKSPVKDRHKHKSSHFYNLSDRRHSIDHRYAENDKKHQERDSRHSEKDSRYSEKDTRHLEKDLRHLEKDSRHSEKDSKHSEKDSKHSEKDLRHSEKDSRHAEKDPKHSEKDSKYPEKEPRHPEKETRQSESFSRHLEKDSRHSEKEPRHPEKDARHPEKEARRSESLSRHSERDSRNLEKDTRPSESFSRHLEKDTRYSEQEPRHPEKDSRNLEKDTRPSESFSRHLEKDSRHSEKELRHPEKDVRQSESSRHLDKESRHSEKDQRYPEKDLRHPEKDVRLSESFSRYSEKDSRHSEKDLRHSEKDVRHSEKDLRHAEKDLRHSEKDLRHSVKDSRHTEKYSRNAERDLRPVEKEKYPLDWKDLVSRRLSLDQLKHAESSKRSNNLDAENATDANKMMKFNVPPIPMVPLRYRKVNDGQESVVPAQFVRYTTKMPRIAYSVNFTRIKNVYFNRNQVYDVVSKNQKDGIRALIAQAKQEKPILPYSSLEIRKWYPKTPFSPPQCEILEPSLGLSILQSYMDEDEPEADAKRAKLEKNESGAIHEPQKDVKKKAKKRKKSKLEKKKVKKKQKKIEKAKKKKKAKHKSLGEKQDRSKRKIKNKKARDKNSSTPEIVTECEDVKEFELCKKNSQINMESLSIVDLDDFKNTSGKYIFNSYNAKSTFVNNVDTKLYESFDSQSNKSDDSKRKRKSSKDEISNQSTESNTSITKVKDGSNHSTLVSHKSDLKPCSTPPMEKEVSPVKDVFTSTPNIAAKSPETVRDDAGSPSDSGTPDTDEYHSHWESDDELLSTKRRKNTSWESDEEDESRKEHDEQMVEPKSSGKVERSLEMPLNISFSRSRNTTKSSPKRYSRRNDKSEHLLSDDSWGRSDFTKFNCEIRELQIARRTLSEERRLLEKEKRMIEEREKQIGLREKFVEWETTVPEDYDENKVIKQESVEEVMDNANTKRRSRKSRWEDPIPEEPKVVIKEEKEESEMFSPEPVQNSLSNTSNSVPECEKVNVLENEYEQFMKAVSSNTPETKPTSDDNQSRKRKSSTSSSSAASSRSSSSSSSSSLSSQSSKNTNQIVCLDDVPLPVPSPRIELPKLPPSLNSSVVSSESPNCMVDSTSSPAKKMTEASEIDLENRKPLSSIIIAKKPTQLLDNSLFKDSDESDNEKRVLVMLPDFDIPMPAERKRSPSPIPEIQNKIYKMTEVQLPPKREPSPKRRRSPPRRPSPRRSRHLLSPRKRRESPRRRYRDRFSPRKSRDSPPRYRDRSPRRNRSLSPPHRRRSRSPSKERKKESIQETLTRIAGMDRYEHQSRSPVDSPLDGFRRSLADSTISDEQLMQNQEQYIGSPAYYNNNPQFKNDTASPKRIPLEDRINQVLGIEKEEPKPISTTYSQDYNNYNSRGYYDQYGSYSQEEYENKNFDEFQPQNVVKTSVTKVLQVGNVLQVVPSEEITTVTTVTPVIPVIVEKKIEVPQKILQVGNMLQIVPTATLPSEAIINKELKSAEELMKQKAAERKAERESRRLERENRRIDKEKKRKEKEKRRQLKMKLKTEDVIKRALLLDTEGNGDEFDDTNDLKDSKLWLSIPSVISMGNRPVGKSILVVNRSKDVTIERQKKGVKFADGIIPGEGTSPSGGEELSSPPPMPVKALKEKRFTKTKKPKKVKQPKKKIKVKVIKKSPKLDEEEDDNLPPPSPPPGSPPPHVFPPRLKLVIKKIQPVQNYIPQNQPPPLVPSQPPPPLVPSQPPPPLLQTQPQSQPLGMNYPYPTNRPVETSHPPHFLQGGQSVPNFPPNMTSVPPPNMPPLHAPPQLHGPHGSQPPYPPPPIGMHQLHHSHHPPQNVHQGQQGGRPIQVKQSFNNSISPPQHMLGPHNG